MDEPEDPEKDYVGDNVISVDDSNQETTLISTRHLQWLRWVTRYKVF